MYYLLSVILTPALVVLCTRVVSRGPRGQAGSDSRQRRSMPSPVCFASSHPAQDKPAATPSEPNHGAARVHVLLAREAPVGLVIRRGPSTQVCTIGWNRMDDTFTVGQWLKGRIYERRCDLSPDGRYFLYFAMNGKWKTETRGSWTAISIVPCLKAIGLWPKGDTWQGGGLFIDNQSYWINDRFQGEPLRVPTDLRQVSHYDGEGIYGSECPGVYYLRLQRDGWTLAAEPEEDVRDQVHAFLKPIGQGWTLRKFAHSTMNPPKGRGCYYDDHEVVRVDTGEVIQLQDCDWADVDGTRLVYSKRGRLLATEMTPNGPRAPKTLVDLNEMVFEHRVAEY